jgi:hypothetical protein
VGAGWDDLVHTAQDRTLKAQEYRPIAGQLFDQVRRRGLDAEKIFRDLAWIVVFGRGPGDVPGGRTDLSPEERIALARAHVGTPAKVEPVVGWLGYQGSAFPHLSAGRVFSMNAHWAVPKAELDDQDPGPAPRSHPPSYTDNNDQDTNSQDLPL